MSSDPELLVIKAGQTERHYWRDLWRFRELLGFLAWRDIKVRYKQAVLGVAWALIQPVITTVIFTVVFGRLAGMPAGGVPYPVLVLSGLMAWQLFSASLTGSSASLVTNANLVSKIYFPRLLVPVSTIGVAIIDFMIVFALFLGIAAWYGHFPSWHWLVLPFFVLLAVATALGAGLLFSALTVKFRDFKFIVPFIVQVGVFVSPVGFRTDYFPSLQPLLSLNPLTSIITGFRWCLLNGNHLFDPQGLAKGIAIIVVLNVVGLWYFRRTERKFADVI